jgi:hypothetical protein
MRKIYVLPEEGFDLYGMVFKNPMMLLMLVAVGLAFGTPKLPVRCSVVR